MWCDTYVFGSHDGKDVQMPHMYWRCKDWSFISRPYISANTAVDSQQIPNADQSNMCSQPCLKVGTSLIVNITCTQNGPCSFYVQCETDHLKLGELAHTLNSAPLELLKTSLHTGLPCTSRFDKNLSRAVIVSVTEDTCEIFLVDHGVRLHVPHHELYHLPEEFIHPISLAIRFKLSDIENSSITPKLCEIFSDLVQNKKMRLEVTDVEEYIPCCELYNEYNIKISDILKQHLSSHNVEYPAFDISDHLNCRVVISYINTTSVFLPWSFSVNLESSILDIEDIMVQVNQYCQTEATIVPDIITATRNEPIIAQYSENGMWYRAKILQNYNGKSATVFFVDYGHYEEVLPSATRPAPEKLINNLPPQSILCRLQHANYLPTAPCRLNQITNMKAMLMSIIQVLPTGECLVRMCDTSVYPVKDLAKDLIAFHSSLNINYQHQELYGQPQVHPYGMPPYTLTPGPRSNFPLDLHYYGQLRGHGVQIAKCIPRPLGITAPPPSVKSYGNQQESNQGQEKEFGEKGFANQPDKNNGRGRRWGNQQDENRDSERRFGNQRNGSRDKEFGNQSDRNQFREKKLKKIGENNTRRNDERGRFERQGKTSETKCQKYVEENWDLAPLPSIKPVSMKYSQINLQVGKEFEAIHVFANHPSDFFIQPISSASQLEDVMAKIVTFCDSNVSSPCVVQFDVDDSCLAQFSEDFVWYRAKVLSIEDNKCEVQFVDFGNTDNVYVLTQMKNMPSDLLELPAQAIRCSLRGVAAEKVWSVKETYNFASILDANTLKVTLVGLDSVNPPKYSMVIHQGDTCINEQYETSSWEVEATLNEQVFVSYSKGLYVSLQYASLNDKLESMQEELQIAMEVEQLPLKPGDSSLVAAKNPEDKTWYRAQLISPMNEEETGIRVFFVDYGIDDIGTEVRQLPTQFCNILPFAMPCILPLKPLSTEELNVKEMYDKIQDIIYEENITLTFKKYTTHENKFVIDLFLNNKSLIDTLTEEKLATSLIEKVYISTISESEFNIQLVKDEINIHEIEEKLTQEVYPDVSTVEVGKIYIAKYTEDNVWCRVKIIQCIENGFIANFIDYGNTAIVTEIKQLPEDLALFPPLSTLCVLTNIEDMDSLVEAAINGSVVQVLMSASEERPMKISLVKDSSIILLTNNEESSEMKQTEEILEITTCPDTYKDSAVQLTPVTESDNVYQESKTLAVILESALLKLKAKQKKEAELISENTKEIEDVKLCSIADAEKAQNQSEIRDHIESVEEKEDVKLCSTEDTEIHDQIEGHIGEKDVKSEGSEIIQNPSEIQEIKGEKEISKTTEDKVTEIKVSTCNENLSTSTQADKEKGAEKIELTSTENIETNEENTELINIRIVKYSKPTAFWCQNIDDLDKLTFIEESVSKLYSELLTTMEDGKLYAAQSNINKKWYRVRKWDTYYALFIDYGTLENVTNFTELSQELQEIPPLATYYSYDISNVNPSNYHQLKDIINNPNTIFQASIYNNNKISLFIDGENIIDIVNQTKEMELSEICVSHFDDLENFYVHEISDLHKIADLNSELQNTATETIETVEIGTRCLAKFKADDNSWQRVDIISEEADNTYKVLLIDHGNTILASELRKIPSNMVAIPPLAKRCHLLNIPNDEFIRLQLTFLLVDSIFITFDANLSEYVEGTSLGINLMTEGENVMEKLKFSCKKTLLFDEKTTADKSLLNISNTEKSSPVDIQATEIPCKDTQEVQDTEIMSTEEVKDTETLSTEEVQDTETMSTKEVQDTETMSTKEVQDTDTLSTEEVQDTETMSTKEVQDTETLSTEEVQHTETLSTKEVQDTETLSTEEVQDTETMSTKEVQDTDTLSTKEVQDTETMSTEEVQNNGVSNETSAEKNPHENIKKDDDKSKSSHFENIKLVLNIDVVKQVEPNTENEKEEMSTKIAESNKEGLEEPTPSDDISDSSSDSSNMELKLYKTDNKEKLSVKKEKESKTESKIEIKLQETCQNLQKIAEHTDLENESKRSTTEEKPENVEVIPTKTMKEKENKTPVINSVLEKISSEKENNE